MYSMIFLILFLLSFVEMLTKKIDNRIFNLVFIILTIMLIFRYGQGPDYVAYEHEYNTILLRDNLKSFILLKGDYLFWGMTVLLSYFSIPFEIFVGLIAFFSMRCLYKFIIKHSKYRAISLFIFYCLFYVYFDTLLRQAISLSIVIAYVFDYIVEKRYSKAILFTILASLFHQSALILVIGILLLKIKEFNYKIILPSSIVVVILSYFGVFETLINILPSFLKSRMIWYIYSQGNIMAFLNRLFIYIIVMFLIMLNKSTKSFTDKDRIFIKLYSLFLLIYSIFFKVNLVASRLDIYFRIIEIILIPNLLYGLKGKFFYRTAPFILIGSIFLNTYFGINYYKNTKMFLYQGNYYTESVFEYPYISIFNKDKIYEKSNYSYNAIMNK